jgi:rare lipoprotein A
VLGPEPASPPTVVASYFGPGLYGNRTACGSTLTNELEGVAHRTLPCGTHVTLAYGAATVTVRVIDRGPFIASREFDLTYATKVALGCPDLCHLLWAR